MTPLSRFIKKIAGTHRFPTGSIFWLGADRLFRLIASLAVGIAVARHLGPTGNGFLQSGIALATLLSVGVELGLDSVLRREIVRAPDRVNELLGTTVALRTIALMPSILVFVWVTVKGEHATVALTAWLSILLSLPIFLTFESWFLVSDATRENVFAQNIALFVGAIARVVLILTFATVEPFGAAAASEVLLSGFCLWIFYRSRGGRVSQWRVDRKIAGIFLRDSAPLLFTNIASALNRRVDLVILASMVSEQAAGTYAAAVRLAELGYVLPMVLVNAYFPLLTRLQKTDRTAYTEELNRFFILVTWIGIAFSAVVSMVSPWLIVSLYGAAFKSASIPLTIYAWATVLICQNIARSLWLLLENQQTLGLTFALAGAATNVLLNFLLIPRYGITGAALSYLISHFVSQYGAPLFSRRARPVLKMGLGAFFPLRSR